MLPSSALLLSAPPQHRAASARLCRCPTTIVVSHRVLRSCSLDSLEGIPCSGPGVLFLARKGMLQAQHSSAPD